jgi:capsular exopolysaccharide synthesis family protein
MQKGKAFPFPGGRVFLRSAFRAAARRWPVAAAVAGGVFLFGLFFIPRALSFTARARLVLSADRWSAGHALDFAQSPAVLDEAARSLGYDDGSELRPGLSLHADPGAVSMDFTAATRGRAIERLNAVGHAFESRSAAARRLENAAALKRIEDALADRRQPPASRESPADRAARERLGALERQVETDRVEIASISARMEILGRVLDRNDAGPARPVNTAESDRISAELDLSRRHLEELRATYPGDWPPVVRAAARVEELLSRRAIATNREILEARFAPMREAIEELRELSSKRDRAQRDLASREAELRPLRDRIQPGDDGVQQDRARQEALAASIRDLEGARTRLTLERAGGDSVIERFEPAGSARFSGAALPLLLAIALVLGFAAAWASETLAVTIRTEHDIRRYVNLPLLAVVPHVKEPGARIMPAAGSGVTEAFNTLAALLETRTKEDGSRLFALTSAVPSEGKSTVACNVAVALARAGSRVLLVDADLRRGTQHKLFSVSNEPGLSAYLQGGTDTIDSMMSATDIDNLTLMPAGAPMQNPIPFLHAERFHALLRDLRGWYEYVIVDLPPVKSAADALIVAPLADAIVLVTAASETRKDDVTYAKRMIRSVKAKMCGCVLTKARIRSGGYYYYPAAVAADAAE